jgi:uncharacterized membrane protein YhfC
MTSLVPASWIAATVAAIAFEIAFPLVLTVVVQRRLKIGWRYFFYGVIIFLLFQLISRVPVLEVLGVVLGPQLKSSRPFLFAFLAMEALTAGIFEEVGRYVGYRWLMRKEQKDWSKAVFYGLGHASLESVVLVAGLSALTLVNVLALQAIGLNAIPEAQRGQAAQQLAAIASQPGWLPLLGAYERFWTIAVHVALSVVVLQVFTRGQLRWLFCAIGAHALVDGVAVFLPQFVHLGSVGTVLLVEGAVTIFGVIAIWVIFALRPREMPAATLDTIAPQMPASQMPGE